jgi:predicted short-subunit dehydrogenase-like oxidoreductase (DUF2520 family)
MFMAIKSVSIIGSGNLATHLARCLFLKGIQIRQIFSRNSLHAAALAHNVSAETISDIRDLRAADLIIICVTDSAIAEVSNQIPGIGGLVVHTSGSTSLNILEKHVAYGIFYPFQTFSRNVEVDFDKVPMFIEANNSLNTNLLVELAQTISSNVRVLTSEQRLKLHLAAVFACNFTNHMYTIAKDILTDADIPFDLLYPLIRETTEKVIKTGNPINAQTGPAVRSNIEILERHKELLGHKPLWQKIYTFVSNSIMEKVTDKRNGTF